MEYNISVQQSNPTGILGVLTYHDSTYGVVLSRHDDGKAIFEIFESANGLSGDEFRLKMDKSGQIREFTMENGEEKNISQPILVSSVEARTISQTEFLRNIADVLTTL